MMTHLVKFHPEIATKEEKEKYKDKGALKVGVSYLLYQSMHGWVAKASQNALEK